MGTDPNMVGRRCIIKDSGSVKAWTIAGIHRSQDRYYLAYEGVVSANMYPADRLEILPVVDHRPAAVQFGMRLDAYRIEGDEATEQLAHTLMLAHMYFQCSPDDARDEVFRLIAIRETDDPNGPVMVGAMAAFDAWHARYEEMKKDD